MIESNNEKVTDDIELPMWRGVGDKGKSFTDNDLIKLLSNVVLFKGLSNKELRLIKAILYERHYNMGEYLFKESHPASTMFIIKEGFVGIEESASMLQPKKNYPIMLTPGDCLGELSLLKDSKRSNSALCTTNTIVLGIFRSDLFDLIRRKSETGYKILQNFICYIDGKLLSISDDLVDCRRKNRELKLELENR